MRTGDYGQVPAVYQFHSDGVGPEYFCRRYVCCDAKFTHVLGILAELRPDNVAAFIGGHSGGVSRHSGN